MFVAAQTNAMVPCWTGTYATGTEGRVRQERKTLIFRTKLKTDAPYSVVKM